MERRHVCSAAAARGSRGSVLRVDLTLLFPSSCWPAGGTVGAGVWGAWRSEGTRKKKKATPATTRDCGSNGRTKELNSGIPSQPESNERHNHRTLKTYIKKAVGQFQKSTGLKFTLCSEEGNTQRSPGLLRNFIFNVLTHNKHLSAFMCKRYQVDYRCSKR